MSTSKNSIIPCLRYRETEAALDWLCAVFGFDADELRTGPDGNLEQARLSYGSSHILLAQLAIAGECDPPCRLPLTDESPAAQACSLLLLVDDIEPLYQRAVDSGAHMLQALDEQGSRFVCRDPEGHVWSFSTSHPW